MIRASDQGIWADTRGQRDRYQRGAGFTGAVEMVDILKVLEGVDGAVERRLETYGSA